MKIERKFAPTTVTFESETELKKFSDVLYAAHRQYESQRGLWSAGKDTDMTLYIQYLIKELR